MFILYWIVFLQMLLANTLFAQGNLLLMPRRVLFEGSKRFEELNLANTGNDTARYVISLIHLHMKPDGSFEQIKDTAGAGNFVDKFIRFFPRSVTLAPNESQVVKIQVVKAGELTEGEYRSHLYFRAVPNETALGDTILPSKDSSISIRLTPVFGISIPVIIRVGQSNAEVAFSDASLKWSNPQTPVLNMTFSRKGNMSVYGDLSVDYISAAGKTINAGSIKGIAVYTPNTERRMQLNLQPHPDINYHSGKLKITYSTQTPNKPQTLAETHLSLN